MMYYKSTIQQLTIKIKERLQALEVDGGKIDKCLREITISLLASNKRRIHTDGARADGQALGQYSTKETLVGASSFRKISSAEKVFKQKKQKWVTVGGKHLMVLADGYKKIREIDDDQIDKVVLKRTGKMETELKMEPQGEVWVIGFPLNYNSSLSYREMIDAFEKKYGGAIWGVSNDDAEKVNLIVERYIKL